MGVSVLRGSGFRLGSIALLLFLALCLVPINAEANIYIERAIPKPEATIEERPDELRIQYSHTIIAPLSRVQLRDYTGQALDLQQLGSGNELIVPLPELDDGVYYVEWRVIGRDGAVSEGSYRFALNVELSMDATSSLLLEGANLQSDGVGGQSVIIIERIINLVNLILLVILSGWIIFHRFLWHIEGNRFLEINERTLSKLGKSIFWIATGLFFIAGFIHIFVRISLLFEGGEMWQAIKLILASTSLGWITIARPILVLVLYLLFFSRKPRVFAQVMTLAMLVLSFSLGSQGFYTNTIISHFIHLAALVVWIAGLAGFSIYTLFLKKNAHEGHMFFLKRLSVFYNLGLVLIFFLIISGLLLSSVYVGSWPNLFNTAYGETLLWKIILLLPLIALIIWHRFFWIPGLINASQGTSNKENEVSSKEGFTSLILGIRLELGLVVMIFLISGILSTLIPPGDVHQGHQNHKLFIHLDVFEGKESDQTTLLAYILWERKRLTGAEVTFEIWDKEHEDLLTNAEEYCRVNNMSLSFFRQSLIDQGFIYEIQAIELDSVIYSGQLQLTPGLWQVGVNVKHHEPDIEEYNQFLLSINE